MKTIQYIGIAIGISSMILGCVWFEWRLSLVIFLAIAGNNAERINK